MQVELTSRPLDSYPGRLVRKVTVEAADGRLPLAMIAASTPPVPDGYCRLRLDVRRINADYRPLRAEITTLDVPVTAPNEPEPAA